MPCSKCDGCGSSPLQPELQVTLDLLRREGPLTSPGVYQFLVTDDHASETWVNNRLETLRRLGFVTRKKVNARTWLYSAVKP